MRKIDTKNAPVAIGPYSQAIVAGNILYTSGQIPINPINGEIPKGIELQTKQVMENIEAILTEVGANFKNTIKTTCFLTDMSYFEVFNKIYADYFIENPARSCIAVKELPKGVLVEVEAIVKL